MISIFPYETHKSCVTRKGPSLPPAFATLCRWGAGRSGGAEWGRSEGNHLTGEKWTRERRRALVHLIVLMEPRSLGFTLLPSAVTHHPDSSGSAG